MKFKVLLFAFAVALGVSGECCAERFLVGVPRPASSAGIDFRQTAGELHARPPTPETAEARSAAEGHWADYLRAWADHAEQPGEPGLRKRLGLPPRDAVEITQVESRVLAGLPPALARVAWSNPLRLETPHFILVADLQANEAAALARDLESFYAVWTQIFFPLWSQRSRWDRTGSRSASPAKHKVVCFRDADRYATALAREGPGIARSTGYYSGAAKVTFLRTADADEDSRDVAATRYHELTHQLLAEATDSRLRGTPGERTGFWLLEGIACYMESTAIADGYAAVGGWQAARLQFARHRTLVGGDSLPLSRLDPLSRTAFQRSDDPARLYSFAAAHCHRLIDRDSGRGLADVLARLASLYQIRGVSLPRASFDDTDDALAEYLRLDDARLLPVRQDDLTELCLARCDVSAEGLRRIAPQQRLRWLDLTGLSVENADVRRLVPGPGELRQLSLEATRIDAGLADWLAGAGALSELDLSWTAADDGCIAAIGPRSPLETVWLTGSAVSDRTLDRLAAVASLKRVDVQRTGVSEEGRSRFRSRRPDVVLDPLELVSSP